MSIKFDLDYLAEYREFIPAIAAWHHEEWAYLRPGDTIEARTARLCAELGYRQIPTTVVAFKDKQVFGSAQLIAHDMDTHMDLTPWLASVYVGKAFRGRGIASALVGRIVEEARALGVGKLYLYTDNAEGLYSKLGWTVIEKTRYINADVTIMAYKT